MPSRDSHPGESAPGDLNSDKSNGPANLVLFFDGTTNTFHGSRADTNVVKLLRKLERDHPNQYHYYQTGIGTYEVHEPSINQSFLSEIKSFCYKALDQMLGYTFDAHVMAGYKFIMRYYQTGAKIYIFGFSRGAYAAKFLAQMMNTVGLLCKGNEEMVPFAYRLFQHYTQGKVKLRKEELKEHGGKDMQDALATPDNSDDEESDEYSGFRPNESYGSSVRRRLVANSDHFAHKPGTSKEKEEEYIRAARREIRAFSKAFCRKDRAPANKRHNAKNIRVHFLGLWDCVGSIAVLERNVKAPMPIFGTAEHVRHAVAVDEHRVMFRPSLLSQDISLVAKSKRGNNSSQELGHAKKAETGIEGEDIREVWFPGSHGDIGGGRITQNVITKNGPMVTWLNKLFGLEAADAEVFHKDQVDLSDVALAWMIEEIHAIDGLDVPDDDQLPDALGSDNPPWKRFADAVQKKQDSQEYKGLHWNPRRLWEFKQRFLKWNAETEQHFNKTSTKLEPMNYPLQFNRGTALPQVIFWKFFECMPFIHRWELNYNKWHSSRFWPNFCHPRDIPPKAVIHDSVYRRLRRDKEYVPGNTHGNSEKGTPPCIHPDVEKEEHEWSRDNHKLWTFK